MSAAKSKAAGRHPQPVHDVQPSGAHAHSLRVASLNGRGYVLQELRLDGPVLVVNPRLILCDCLYPRRLKERALFNLGHARFLPIV